MRQTITQILLWTAVLAWSLWFGGLLYEMAVITPLWSSDPPQSVIEWNSREQFAVIPTPFYAPVAVVTILSSAAGLILAWRCGERRLWLVLSAACAIFTLAFTFVYFFPKNEVIFHNRYIGLSGEEISNIAYAWIAANWIRVVIMAVGFFAALRVYNNVDTERSK
jgi:hypothetical protein